MKVCIPLFFLITLSMPAYDQARSPKQLNAKADSLYFAKNFSEAAACYHQLISLYDFMGQKSGAAYNAACCYALSQQKDSAVNLLRQAIRYGYHNRSNLVNDADLVSLHVLNEWKEIVNKVPAEKGLNTNPDKAVFHTEDIHHFWQAYDLAQKDTAHAGEIYTTYYFNKASAGMNDYMALKVGSLKQFVQHINSHPAFYASIRSNTQRVDDFKKKFLQSFRKLKEIYPAAAFPDVYFVIGAFTSAGTVSGAGLLIGVNQVCKDDKTVTRELSEQQQLLMNQLEVLPNTIAHECIHFQQDSIVSDTTNLSYAIREGMADFIGELISGQTSNPKIHAWIKGKEKQVWQKFQAGMYQNRYNDWIANYSNPGPGGFPDLGYWVGYAICRSYYETASDKKQAIYDMLHIRDFRQFLKNSHWDPK